MGLTERHWFENEDVPENYERDLEDAVYAASTLTAQIPIMMAKTHLATRCLACDETIDLGPLDKASTRYICDKCKAAIRWARHRMDAEHGRTDDD